MALQYPSKKVGFCTFILSTLQDIVNIQLFENQHFLGEFSCDSRTSRTQNPPEKSMPDKRPFPSHRSSGMNYSEKSSCSQILLRHSKLSPRCCSIYSATVPALIRASYFSRSCRSNSDKDTDCSRASCLRTALRILSSLGA